MLVQMTYLNHEGVPVAFDTTDYFREVTLFRQHHFSVPLSAAARSAMRFWETRTNHGQCVTTATGALHH